MRAAILLMLVNLVLVVLALISCLSVEDRRTIRGIPRFGWVMVILLVPLAGPVAWFYLGRPTPRRRGPTWRAATGLATPPRPRAPDDDPDFLRSLDQRLSPQDEETLRRWQEELSRGEEDRRRNEPGGDA